MPAYERIERALGLLIGTVVATTVFLASFFIVFGDDAPSGLVTALVTVTIILALFPVATAGVRLALGVRAAEGTLLDGLATSQVVKRSIWSGIIINAVLAVLGMVASMGMLIIVLAPYLIASSAVIAGVAALLGWSAARIGSWLLAP